MLETAQNYSAMEQWLPRVSESVGVDPGMLYAFLEKVDEVMKPAFATDHHLVGVATDTLANVLNYTANAAASLQRQPLFQRADTAFTRYILQSFIGEPAAVALDQAVTQKHPRDFAIGLGNALSMIVPHEEFSTFVVRIHGVIDETFPNPAGTPSVW